MRFSWHPPVVLMTSMLMSWLFSTVGPFMIIVPSFLKYGFVAHLVIGLLLIVSAFIELKKMKTTIIPTGTPTALATKGPYRLTRNPIYLGYLLIAFGMAWFFGSLTGFIGPLYFFWIIDGIVIPQEEKNLHEAIGFSYGDYLLNTRRWL